jgi:hypothetical protein
VEDIQKYLPTCDFIAFDEEMSGIFMDGVSNSRADTANQRYTKMCKIAKRFSIIQFGIALFTKCDGGGYVSRPYNFYLFPTKAQDIVLSASAIGFLKKHGMDFQKVGRWCMRGGEGGVCDAPAKIPSGVAGWWGRVLQTVWGRVKSPTNP